VFRTRRLWLLVAGPLLMMSPQSSAPGVQTYRLALDTAHYLPAPARVVAEDLVLDLEQGAGFVAFAGQRPTVLVLVGQGTLRFSPPIRSEQRQLQLFAGAQALVVRFETAYVRLHPAAFDSHVEPASLCQGAPPSEPLRRAQVIFQEEIGRSFALETLEPGGPSPPAALLPSLDDFLAEVHTRRYGRLTYLRLASEPEDVTLVDRDRGRTLVVYPSGSHRAALGFAYGDEYGLPYEALHYDIETSVDPARLAMAGRTRLQMRVLDTVETVKLRLDRGLVVGGVRSAEQGVHQFLQEPASDTLLVRLVPPLATGRQINLEVTYKGTAKPQGLAPGTASEGSGPLALDQRSAFNVPRSTFNVLPGLATPGLAADASILYSNRVYWFPQSPVRNHATATLRVDVPSGFVALASAPPEQPPRILRPSGAQTCRFRTDRPVRYVALLVGRLEAVDNESSTQMPSIRGMASPRLISRARAAVRDVADMAHFFSSLIGEMPFAPLTLALVEAPLPAAHSPAYLSILGEPPGWNPALASDDPAYFTGQPEFFLAHEVAHQWWGQAVGWRNYREQWLSEAFAQYFAALYIQHRRGEEAFASVLAWMRRWAVRAAGKGPINLGIRAGQIAGGREDFVAVVYDRGAYVLHMLRGLLGDDAFFRGLRAYFERWKFRRAGTDDLRRALEETSGVELGRFFDQWVRDDGQPELRWAATFVSQGDRPRLRLRLEQIGEAFELPLQVRIDYEDRPSTTERIRVWLAQHEYLFDLHGRFKRVRLNADLGAVCQLREQR
jgi:hypothetical protein